MPTPPKKPWSDPSPELLPPVPLFPSLSPSLLPVLLASPESPAESPVGPPDPEEDAPDPSPARRAPPCSAVAADESAAADEHPDESGVPEPPPRPRFVEGAARGVLCPLRTPRGSRSRPPPTS